MDKKVRITYHMADGTKFPITVIDIDLVGKYTNMDPTRFLVIADENGNFQAALNPLHIASIVASVV